ncbi:hypothetical protein Clacol_000660 [Clathrus columnatus]|uniref:Telomere replication protein EST3 n=1 Tax=Clathrus columnatus TaxID=1419009 RepID=A0AAV4ZZ21_9AGAM|nr:hypothetical protein Clacol_000660 [Clathrus columnatus]
MSEGLKPWLYKYLTGYASTYGDLGKSLPKRGKVQILNFLSVPKTEEEFLWADISDKEFIIPARFTPGAVKTFNANPFNADRPLLSRRSAIAVVSCKQPLRSKPPLGIQKGIDPVWKIVLEIDELDVIACEGEARFGEPSELNSTPFVRFWLEGLAKGQGNLMKQQLNETREKDKLNSNVEANPTGLNTRQALIRHDSDFEKRYRQWKREIVSLGLVSCYESAEVSFEQSGISITSTQGEYSLLTLTIHTKAKISTKDPMQVPTSREPASSCRPTTPSQWSNSGFAHSSPENHSGRSSSEEAPHHISPPSSFILEAQNREEDAELEVHTQNDELPNLVDHVSSSPQHMPEPTILVPDSDVSHSQSQSLKFTQQVESERSNLNHLMTTEIPQTSLEHYQAVSPDHSPGRNNTVVPLAMVVESTEDNIQEVSCSEGVSHIEESKSIVTTSDPFAESPNALQFNRGQKRRPSVTMEDRGEGPSKRVKPSGESISRRHSPLHDPAIWEKPNFLVSPIKRTLNNNSHDQVSENSTFQQQVQNKPETTDGTHPKQTPESNSVDNTDTLKLGGWQPDWDFEGIPGIVTYKTLKALLSRVTHERGNV